MTNEEIAEQQKPPLLPDRSCADGCNGCDDCTDYDEDCADLEDKVGCWLYDPGRGMCPYLRAKQGA
jgi:hypothetical protein